MILNCNTYRKATLYLLITLLLACSVSTENRDKRVAFHQKTLENCTSLDLDYILSKGKLTVLALSSSNSYFLYKGEPLGFEFELLDNYAKHIGVKLEVIIAQDVNEIFTQLQKGEVDLVAANLAVTKDRAELVAFTEPYLFSKQVLVQRKPDNYNNLNYAQQQKAILRNPIQLAGKEIYVHKNSSFYSRLKSLGNEIGGVIKVIDVPGDVDPETLIELVAKGHIDYTIADEHVAKLNQGYYQNIDASMAISFPQKIAWACRKESPALVQSINTWLAEAKKHALVGVLYNKYFNSVKDQTERNNSLYSSLSGGKISPYDKVIQKHSKMLGWDWRLVAAQMAQESNFNAQARSWAGAFGLMQMMPETGKQFGIDSLSSPEEQIKAGINYMMWLNTYWENSIDDEEERIKFVLASYNVGLGHVIDAKNLTDCFGGDSSKWENHVDYFLRNKSSSEFQNSEWVKYGYCHCTEPVDYVEKILNRYAHYKKLIS